MRNPAHSGVPLLWWTWMLVPTLRPAPTVPVHVAEDHRPALIKAHAWQGRRGRRTARLHSCGLPVVKLLPMRGLRSSSYFRIGRSFPPSSTLSLRQTDRRCRNPSEATRVRCFWWTAALSTSASTRIIA